MTNDDIATVRAACERVGLERASPSMPDLPGSYVVEFNEHQDWCAMRLSNPALHAYLVLRLMQLIFKQRKFGASLAVGNINNGEWRIQCASGLDDVVYKYVAKDDWIGIIRAFLKALEIEPWNLPQ
jgi:hypothetical protein